MYFGTLAIIGLSTPENYYNQFVADYFNFIGPLRTSLLLASHWILSIFGFQTFLSNEFTLSIQGGAGVRMVYSCIGYGVMSFWGAFVFANKGGWQKKLKWILGGWAALWFINVVRVSLLLLATDKNWSIPFGWDHHTWFNIAAYALIFGMIYFYDRAFRGTEKNEKNIAFLKEPTGERQLAGPINQINNSQ